MSIPDSLPDRASTISVVIPVYNRADTVRRAIESAKAQTLPPLEIIVVDDASTPDEAARIAMQAGDGVRILRLDRNVGAAGARNAGFSIARGAYIALLDSDDYWAPEKLERQLAFLRRHKARICMTGYRLAHIDGPAGRTVEEIRIPSDVSSSHDMVWGCTLSPGSTALFERALLDEVGPQCVDLPRLEDWDWLLLVARLTPIPVVPEPLTWIEVLERPQRKSVYLSAWHLMRRHTGALFSRNPVAAMKFLASLLVEAAAAAHSEGKRVELLLFGLTSLLFWPFRDQAFFARAFSRVWVDRSTTAGRRDHRADPVHVLHVIASLDAGGAERMLYNIIKQTPHPATRQGKDNAGGLKHCVVVLRKGGKYFEAVANTDVRVESLDLTSILQAPRAIAKLRRLVKEFEPSVVKCWMYHANLLGFLSLLGVRRARPKLIWGIRCSDMDLSRYSMQLRIVVWANAFFSSFVDQIAVNSYAGLRVHRALGFRNKHWSIFDNGVDLTTFERYSESDSHALRRELGVPPSAFLIVVLARFDPMKGYDVLQQSLEGLTNTWCVCAGRGTKHLKTSEFFIALGEYADTAGLLMAADAFVLPSIFGEGLSNALLEAMAAGCAIVATDVGDSARAVGTNGLIVPPGSAAALADGITFLRDSPEERIRLGRAAQSQAREKFSLARSKEEFFKLVTNAP